jgi:rhombotail lipoprotein
VFDIQSRALLFNAAGRSKVERSSTALEASSALRADARRGFDDAIDDMILELEVALEAFRVQAQKGSVRGAGTPSLAVSGEGAGASGVLELALVAALAAGAALRRRAAAR